MEKNLTKINKIKVDWVKYLIMIFDPFQCLKSKISFMQKN